MTYVMNLVPDWWFGLWLEDEAKAFSPMVMLTAMTHAWIMALVKFICFPIVEISKLVPGDDPTAIWEVFCSFACAGVGIWFIAGRHAADPTAIQGLIVDVPRYVWAIVAILLSVLHFTALKHDAIVYRAAAVAASTTLFLVLDLLAARYGLILPVVMFSSATLTGLVSIAILHRGGRDEPVSG